MTPYDQEHELLESLMDNLDCLQEDDSLSEREKGFTFSIIIASYLKDITEDLLRKLIGYADLDTDDPEIWIETKAFINACHFGDLYRVTGLWEEDSIIDSSGSGGFLSMVSEQHSESIENARRAVTMNRAMNGIS